MPTQKKPSYGIMPWVRVNMAWYFLAQVGYSSELYDCKIDPLRGEQEEGEAPWDTAKRECNEESGRSHTLFFFCMHAVIATCSAKL